MPDEHAERFRQLRDWLAGLPKPVGVFTFSVTYARELVVACHAAGLRIPDDVAILSGSGDDVECHLATPPLSAIDQNGEEIGWQAASMLHELMQARALPERQVRIGPLGVIRRQSTDLLAVEDDEVARAIVFIREHVAEGIKVGHVVANTSKTRRQLEHAFRKTVGRTLHEQIAHERLERAKRLLLRSNRPLVEVADASGFGQASRLCEAFRKALGTTPKRFRSQYRNY